jgi:hypothetical protein
MRRSSLVAVLALGALAFSGDALAQIKQPGAHAHYDTEIEPHLFIQWNDEPTWNDEGFGLGLRVTIPLVHNGPIDTINNNMGIGFGFDWAHFDDACLGGGFRLNGNVVVQTDGCEANEFWVPVVWQWNFFFSKLISALFEPGLALEYTDGLACDNEGGPGWVCDDSDLDIEFVLWLGVRFHLGDDFALVLRLGTPSLDFGPAFFL